MLQRPERTARRLSVSEPTGVSSGLYVRRMQRLEERYQHRHLGGAQVLAVRRHLTSALQHLADELIVRQPRSDVVECGTVENACDRAIRAPR